MVGPISNFSLPPLAVPQVPQAGAPPVQDTTSFGDILAQFSNVLKEGEQAAIKGISGEMPMQQVVEKVLEAERALSTAVSIRDKVVSAYLEMTRMQI